MVNGQRLLDGGGLTRIVLAHGSFAGFACNPGDFREGNLAGEESGDGHFVGGVEHGRHRPALPQRLHGDPERGETAKVWLLEGQCRDLGKVEEAWFHSRVLTNTQYQAVVRLLAIFAQHLSIVGNQLLVQERTAEPPSITRARKFIDEHQAETLSLGQVAQAVNMSSFYFCKVFKKATGLNFTDYVSRVRIERAKNLLLNPNVRVTEVAYEVGFQTLTHFNRVFRKVTGESPSSYRSRLPAAKVP